MTGCHPREMSRRCSGLTPINTNTVLRALCGLRDEGLLKMWRRSGVRVAGTPERGMVLARARDLVSFARKHGYRRDELVEMIEHLS